MKICSKCKIEKDESKFYRDKSQPDGFDYSCKNCKKIARKNKLDNNPEYREMVNTRAKQREKLKRDNDPEYREMVNKNMRDKRNNDPEYRERQLNLNKERYKNDDEYRLNSIAYSKKWRRENTKTDEYRAYERERKALEKKNNPLSKLKQNIRSLIGIVVKSGGYKKHTKTAEILGCSFEEFYAYIESQFQEGMSWENRSLWHLDHIYPVSRAVDEEHLIALNHYTNFQPLWAEDNLRKGNRLPEDCIDIF